MQEQLFLQFYIPEGNRCCRIDMLEPKKDCLRCMTENQFVNEV